MNLIQIKVKQKKMKSQSLIIDLIKTLSGYSIFEDQTLINKPATIFPHTQLLTNQINIHSKAIKQKLPPTTIKKLIPQQNFTIHPYIYTKQLDNHKYVIIPAKSQWFNLNLVHEIEKKALPEWFKPRKGVSASINLIKFEKNEDMYRKYRNYIIQLGKVQYVTSFMARKGLAGDACSIIRIHNFLEKWGLINFVYPKSSAKEAPSTKQIQENNTPSNQFNQFSTKPIKRKDCLEKDKMNWKKIYDKDQLELIKKITKKFRPICKICEGICGIVWYEYKENLQVKKFTIDEQIQIKTFSSDNQKFQYEIQVCFSCYIQKSFPFVLSFDDFSKVNVFEIMKLSDSQSKFNKKSQQQNIMLTEIIEKNKFNIKKSSEILNLSEHDLLSALMNMPIINLEKISGIQVDTDDQIEVICNNNIPKIQQNQIYTKYNTIQQKIVEQPNQQDIKIFNQNFQKLEIQEKKYYEQFLQCWLLKMYSKLQQLGDWDKSVQWKIEENKSIQKYHLAEKLRKNVKI